MPLYCGPMVRYLNLWVGSRVGDLQAGGWPRREIPRDGLQAPLQALKGIKTLGISVPYILFVKRIDVLSVVL